MQSTPFENSNLSFIIFHYFLKFPGCFSITNFFCIRLVALDWLKLCLIELGYFGISGTWEDLNGIGSFSVLILCIGNLSYLFGMKITFLITSKPEAVLLRS